MSDDYPVLVAPGKPKLRVNASADEVVRYAPKKIDVINMEANRFESMAIADLLKECGQEYPSIGKIISIHRDGLIRRPLGAGTDFTEHNTVVTFDGLIRGTTFVKQIAAILAVLKEAIGTPVDIEFVSNGSDFWLLQCRTQSYSRDDDAVEIPRNLREESILFTAKRFVSNGRVPDVTHLVYVVPEKYREISERTDLLAAGEAVGKLNKLLPKRQFILMGPGRWGSRGDIKLGVSVSYSDISNAVLLIEIARKKGNYVPELSFGTHFFQDLVEASIRYLPLYPDDEGIQFNEGFLLSAENGLQRLAPEYAYLSDVIRVINIPEATGGRILRVLMNADLEEAVGLLVDRSMPIKTAQSLSTVPSRNSEDHWRWRLAMAERIAANLDSTRFGVKALYVFGSTKNATAGPASDIDLLVHFEGSAKQKKELELWLDGWSVCLSELNYLRTGCRSDGLLDSHIVTDEEIERRSAFALKIGAVTDPARELPLGKK